AAWSPRPGRPYIGTLASGILPGDADPWSDLGGSGGVAERLWRRSAIVPHLEPVPGRRGLLAVFLAEPDQQIERKPPSGRLDLSDGRFESVPVQSSGRRRSDLRPGEEQCAGGAGCRVRPRALGSSFSGAGDGQRNELLGKQRPQRRAHFYYEWRIPHRH